MQAGLVVETAEAREVHDIALLIGYGAAAVNPYLALDCGDGRARPVPVRPSRDRTLHPRARGRPAQGDVEDGHLDGAELSRRADLRGGRARSRARSSATSPARRRGSAASGSPSSAPRRSSATRAASAGAPTIDDELPIGGQYRVAPHAASSTSGTRRRSRRCRPRCARNDAARFAEFERLCDDEERALVTLRGLLEIAHGDPPIAARRGRAGRARSSSASSPARCRSARSAPRRTRRSRSR